jgi:hypothetical protein
MDRPRSIDVVRVEDDRDLETWGKAVRQLCDGVASNDERFAVGWLEADDTVWIVHGPVAAGELADTGGLLASSAGLARTDWCGVASAEQNVALLWREADRLVFTMCTKKGCSGLPARFKLERRLPIQGRRRRWRLDHRLDRLWTRQDRTVLQPRQRDVTRSRRAQARLLHVLLAPGVGTRSAQRRVGRWLWRSTTG